MNTTWVRYPHTVEIWMPTRTTNAAGQRKPSWRYNSTVPCFYIPISSRDRANPTYANRDRDEMYIPPVNVDGSPIIITYDTRFKNVKDRNGFVLRGNGSALDDEDNSDLMEVHSLIKHTGWAGQLRIYQIIALTVVEKGV